MKAKIICILVMTLLITTAINAVGLLNNKENQTTNNSSLLNINRENKRINDPLNNQDRGALFMQLPEVPWKMWDAFFSDIDRSWISFDDFWNVSDPICDVHWWGFSIFWNGTHWVNCDATDMMFDITFYYDDGEGKPGIEACYYYNISPNIVPTGIYYQIPHVTDELDLYYFEVDLDPCCQISNGWISIFKTYSPNDCIFAWMVCPNGNWNKWQKNLTSGQWAWSNWDSAFILTDGEQDIPDLDCRGNLEWTEVKTNSTVQGYFEISNIGDVDSVLQWKIESYPDWGTDWDFSYESGFLTTSEGWYKIDVSLVAPTKPDEEFTGNIKIVNAIDPSDYCEIPVTLKTPRDKTINNPILNWLQNHPYLFPILQKLIQQL